MSNWLENNQTKSVITYTIFVAAATWTAFFYIFDENKVKLHEAQVNKIEAVSREVTARNTVLITRLEYLTKENDKYLRWIENTDKTLPFYEK